MPTPISRLPRKQRKAAFTAHNFARRRFLTVPLSRELRQKYGRRQLPVRKGDTVRVISGSYEGQEERVAKIDTRGRMLTLDNITVKKADQKLKALPVRPNHLLLTKLNLADSWRRRVLKVGDEETVAVSAPPAEVAPEPAPAETKPAAEKAPAARRKTKSPAATTPKSTEGSA